MTEEALEAPEMAELSTEELRVCAGLGISPAAYQARKAAGNPATAPAADAARRFSEGEAKHEHAK